MGRLVKIAIIGYPNVGKSTLFNRLLEERRALVHRLPGMTRDQISCLCKIKDRSFILIDTGGFIDTLKDPFSKLVREKAWEASQDADVLIFLCDAKRGLSSGEEELFLSLRKLNKPIFVVVNKVDSPGQEDRLGEFYRLGDVIPISAEHKLNLDSLREKLYDHLPEIQLNEEKPLRVALVGRINVGKSSLINRLAGVGRLIVSEIPGTTRDSTDTLVRRNGKLFCLLDTAGIRKMSRTKDSREKAGILKAKKDIQRADVICQVLDSQEFPTRQDTAVAHLAHESGKPLLIAVNKWDLITKEVDSSLPLKHIIFSRLDFISYAPVVFVSALTGKRVVKILDMAAEVYEQGCRKIQTSRLNEFLHWMSDNYPAYSRRKKRIKLKYMTQVGILPPTFLVFTSSSFSFSPEYEKLFADKVRDYFGFKGTPVRLFLKKEKGKKKK